MTLSRALVASLQSAGVSLATHVPGFGASQTFAAFRESIDPNAALSFHEEPAYAISYGAALAGRRSVSFMKSHGVAKALNAITDSLSSGITAAMLLLIFEDKEGAHSDNILPIVPILEGARIPYRVCNRLDGYAAIREAVVSSEALRLPFALVFDAAEIDDEVTFAAGETLPDPQRYARLVQQHLVCPLFAKFQFAQLNQKLEEGRYNALLLPVLPELPIGLPAEYQRAVKPYLKLLTMFREIKADFVTGDAGVSTLSALPPYNIVNAASYMGGSIPVAAGALLAGKRNVWAFTGDFSFIAAGHIALTEILERNLPLNILIFANGAAQTTGGQPVNLRHLDRILGGYNAYVRHIPDPYSSDSVLAVLTEASQSEEMRIVIANFQP